MPASSRVHDCRPPINPSLKGSWGNFHRSLLIWSNDGVWNVVAGVVVASRVDGARERTCKVVMKQHRLHIIVADDLELQFYERDKVIHHSIRAVYYWGALVVANVSILASCYPALMYIIDTEPMAAFLCLATFQALHDGEEFAAETAKVVAADHTNRNDISLRAFQQLASRSFNERSPANAVVDVSTHVNPLNISNA